MSGDASDWVWEVEATATRDIHNSLALYASRGTALTAAGAAMQAISGGAADTSWKREDIGDTCQLWTRPDGQQVSLDRVEVLP